MNKKEKKLLMTKVAKGELSMKEAELLMKEKKVAEKGSIKARAIPKNTHKRTKQLKREVN